MWGQGPWSAHILGSEFELGREPCHGCVPGGQGWFLAHTPFPGLFFLPFSYLHILDCTLFFLALRGLKIISLICE